eukprot:scaffold4452_cov103-Isochrysis_galbana.AAC.1
MVRDDQRERMGRFGGGMGGYAGGHGEGTARPAWRRSAQRLVLPAASSFYLGAEHAACSSSPRRTRRRRQAGLVRSPNPPHPRIAAKLQM